MISLADAFRLRFGFDAKPFQVRVANELLSGQSVVLRAPTGSGKTLAALFPFVYARDHGLDFPRQLLYSLPLRVLATSLEASVRQMLPEYEVTLQTGESPNDPQFLIGDIIFATYDQVLSSFLHFPFSLSSRQANVNAGAVVSSYLVFDEVHLMEMARALGTTAELLRWLRCTTPFLIMTATLTDSVVHWLCRATGAVHVSLSPDEIQALPHVRRWTYVPSPLTVESIIRNHTGKTIVVANQVERAQKLYAELKQATDHRAILHSQIVLLHARFTRDDRRQKVEAIRRSFGPQPDDRDTILIATQVIEVGLDVSCQCLHTEIAPASALVQRAGRCARFGSEGKVFVYDAPQDEGHAYLPYNREFAEATREALSLLYNVAAGYREELEFVHQVHDISDRKAIEQFEREPRFMEMNDAIRSRDSAYYRQLVRDIDAVAAIVHRKPDMSTDPFAYEGFSLPYSVVIGAWRKAKESGKGEIFAWYPKERPQDDLYDSTTYEWLPVNSEREMRLAPRIALNPAFAAYDELLGLRLNTAGKWQSPLLPRRPKTERTFYVRETYEEHIRKVWYAYIRYFSTKSRLAFAGSRLERALGMQEGSFDRLLRMVIAFHDTAKMTESWQEAVNGYQAAVGGKPAGLGDFLAHTDYDPANAEQKALEQRFKRPPHALEGGVATCAAVASYFAALSPQSQDGVVRAYLAAIGTHHSLTASAIKEKQRLMAGAAQEAVRVAREVVGLSLPEKFGNEIVTDIPKWEKLNEKFPQPQDREMFLLYLLLVRALRLSDQHSFEEE